MRTSRHRNTLRSLTLAPWKIALVLRKKPFRIIMIKTLLKKIGWAKGEDKNKSKMKIWAIFTCKRPSKILRRSAMTKKVRHHFQSLLWRGWEILKTRKTRRIKRILRPLTENLQRKFWKVERLMPLLFSMTLKTNMITLKLLMSFKFKKSNWALVKMKLNLKVFWSQWMRTACRSRHNIRRKNLSNLLQKF